MGEDIIKRILREFGITETEGDLYLYLARHPTLRGTEMARQLKKDKAQVYHVLKSLQTKGLVEPTLESPTRFVPVPFERIVEATIKSKRDEAAWIESIKQELFEYWRNIDRGKIVPPLEKFLVIEGNHKIYTRITEMINQTKRQLSAISTVPALRVADRFGVLDAVFEHPLKSKVQFRFLTELSEQNANLLQNLIGKRPRGTVNLKSRNPEFGLRLSPQMVIQDEEEILLFITPNAVESNSSQDEICLWTNCKTLVQSFSAVFEDFWRNAEDTENKLKRETEKTTSLKLEKNSSLTTLEVIQLAQKEVKIMTSSQGLLDFWKNRTLIERLSKQGISFMLMAPIISSNLQFAQKLSKFCQVKHISTNHMEVVIVDGKHLFQLANDRIGYYSYTNDLVEVEKARELLNKLWKNAQAPSLITLESILEHVGPTILPLSARTREVVKKRGVYVVADEKPLSEKDVLDKIVHAKKNPFETGKDTNMIYASTGSAVIHPPDYFNLPDMMLSVFHIEKHSSLGEEDAMIVFLWLDTPTGQAYEPVAIIGDNPAAQFAWRGFYPRAPHPRNILLVQKDEIQVRIHGNTLFAGWTVPIPLFPHYTLPPACLQIEGYGDIKTVAYTIVTPSGHKTKIEQNYFEAFVTFFHPTSKYSGPGTDGYFVRDFVATIPP